MNNKLIRQHGIGLLGAAVLVIGLSLATMAAAGAQTASSVPDAPSTPTLVGEPAGSEMVLRVSWSAPDGDGGSAITGYNVRYREPGDSYSRVWVSGGDTSTAISGLMPGVRYEVQVQAVNAEGGSAWSSSAVAAGLPGRPGNVSVSAGPDDPRSQLLMFWSVPDDGGSPIIWYNVRYKPVGDPVWSTDNVGFTIGTGEATAVISGLSLGTRYEVQVQAVNAVGGGDWSRVNDQHATAGSDKPSAPLTPRVSVDGAGVLSVSWSMYEINPVISWYNVRYRRAGDRVWSTDNVDLSGMSASVSGLTPRVRYEVQVQAVNSQGGSDWSRSGMNTVLPGRPMAPTAVFGRSGSETVLRVSWSAPDDDGGSAITGYNVRYRKPKPGDSYSRVWVSGGDTSTAISGLMPGVRYEVQVQAVNAVGGSAWSSSAAAAVVPDQPKDVNVGGDGPGKLLVFWDVPDDGGSPIVWHNVRYRRAGERVWSTDNVGIKANSATGVARITDLVPDARYEVQVQAVNAVGGGAWSPSSASGRFSVLPDAPSAPTLVSERSGSEMVLRVSWSAPDDGGSAITGYNVRYRRYGKPGDSYSRVWVSGGDTSTTISGLVPGVRYVVQVQAINSQGGGAWSSTAVAAGLPGRPGNVSVSAGVDDPGSQLTVFWSVPDDGSSPIVWYNVRYRPVGERVWSTDNVGFKIGTGEATAVISGLSLGTRYEVQVQAVNAVGGGAWSVVNDQGATAGSVSKPSAPLTPRVSVDGASVLRVSWLMYEIDPDISWYNVRYKADGGDWSRANISRSGMTAVISELRSDTRYFVQVQAVNSQGSSAWSASGDATTARMPDAPRRPSVTRDRDAPWSTLRISWEASDDGGSDVLWYNVRYKADRGDWSRANISRSGTTAVISELQPDTHYFVQVQAVTAVGISKWSYTGREFTKRAVPGAPKPLRVRTSASGDLRDYIHVLHVSWEAPDLEGSAEIQKYSVQYIEDTPTSVWKDDDVAVNGRTATIANRPGSTWFQIRVRAHNRLGAGPWSTPIRIRTLGTPDRPARPTVTPGPGNPVTSIEVTWNRPEDNGGAWIYEYLVRIQDATDRSDPKWEGTRQRNLRVPKDTTPHKLSKIITGLTPGKTYRVYVQAISTRIPLSSSDWSPYNEYTMPRR